jgi:hypothetical protein
VELSEDLQGGQRKIDAISKNQNINQNFMKGNE